MAPQFRAILQNDTGSPYAVQQTTVVGSNVNPRPGADANNVRLDVDRWRFGMQSCFEGFGAQSRVAPPPGQSQESVAFPAHQAHVQLETSHLHLLVVTFRLSHTPKAAAVPT